MTSPGPGALTDVFVHPHGLCESDHVGPGTRVWAFAHVLPGARIGAGCNICDGVFVEFASTVAAVQCAIDVQRAMAAAGNGQAATDIQLRIGVNLGDVVVEGGDLYGDGVNLAARLQEMAEPGGIAVSAKVHTEVARRIPLAFEDLGEQSLKNILEPVRVYRLRPDTAAAAKPQAAASSLVPQAAVKPAIVVLRNE